VRIETGQHVCVIGTTGTGKTFFVRNALLPSFDRIIVVDTEDYDFTDFPRVSIATAVKLAKSRYRFAVTVEPKGAEELDALCYGLLDIDTPDTLCVDWDEVTDFSTAQIIPESMSALIRKSRKRGVTMVMCTQRPQLLNKNFLANSAHRVYFYISDYDTRHVRDYAPFLAERLPTIPYGSCYSLYQAPDGTVSMLGRAEKYDWSSRLRKHPRTSPDVLSPIIGDHA
jgi:hypothetical protein